MCLLSPVLRGGDLRFAKRILAGLVSSLVLILALAQLTQARALSTWFVSNAGTDNSTCGTTLALACKTIKYTVNNRALDGDIISIAAGTFSENNIVFAHNVTLNGAGLYSTIVDGGAAGNTIFVNNQYTTTQLSALTIQNGFATTGGGVRNAGTLNLSNLRIINNTASQGGGIVSDVSSSLTINNVTISNNAAGTGAAIYSFGDITVTNSTISTNSATGGGGGIYFAGGSGVITNTTISGNTALSNGGGIFGAGVLAPVNLYNTTVYSNSASSTGGNIYVTGANVNLKNSIVAGSISGGNCTLGGVGSLASNGNNIDSGSTCGFGSTGDLSNTDPQLGPLRMNSPGTTMTHAINLGSPAYNAADDVGCPPTDQRGVTRPRSLGNHCDIGAFEWALSGYFLPFIRK